MRLMGHHRIDFFLNRLMHSLLTGYFFVTGYFLLCCVFVEMLLIVHRCIDLFIASVNQISGRTRLKEVAL